MKRITKFALLAACSTLLVTAPASLAQDASQEQPFTAVITPAFTPVTWDRLVDARNEPQNWLMYSGTLDSQRYSLLDEITVANVSQLEMK